MSNRRIIVILLLCLSAIGVHAQQPTVRSMKETNDFIHQDDQRRDYNKKLCALVKVQVVADIDRVEGNVMGNIVTRGVEKWVYMSEGSYQLKIHLKNHLPVSVNTRDYQIQSLKSNRVYELVIDMGQQQQPSTGSLVVSCPTGQVDYYIDGILRQQRWGTNTWTVTLPPGTHTVTVRREGYEEQSLTVNLEAGKETPARFAALRSVKEIKEREDSIAKAKAEAERKAKEEAKAREDSIAKAKAEAEERARAEAKAKEDSIAKAKKDSLAREERLRKEKEERIKAEEKAKKEKQRKQEREATLAQLAEKDAQSLVMGLTAGYNMATAQFGDNYSGTTSSQSGFHVGVTAELRLSDNFYFNSGLLYSAKGYKYENGEHDVQESATAQYIDVPLLASLRLPMGKMAKLQLNAGPYVALCAGGSVKDEWYKPQYDESFSSAYSGFDYGLQVGTGIDIRYHFHIGISYQLGMGSSYKNRNLMVGLGYRF